MRQLVNNILLTRNSHSQVGSSISSMTKKDDSTDDGSLLSTNPARCRVERMHSLSVRSWVRNCFHFGMKNLSNQNPWLLPHPKWAFGTLGILTTQGWRKECSGFTSCETLGKLLNTLCLCFLLCKTGTTKYLYHRCELNGLMHARHWNTPCTQ